MSLPSKKPAGRAILFLGKTCIEWVSDPSSLDPGYLKGVPTSLEPEVLAGEVQALLGEHAKKPGACKVLLGAGMIHQQIVTLAGVPEKEMRAVLHRKAANSLDTDLRQAVFTAVQLQGQDNTRWLVSSIHRAKLKSLRWSLWSVGFRVSEFGCARQALQAKVQQQLHINEDGQAAIVLGVEVDSVTISLLAKGGLVQQAVVPGQFDVQSSIASAVLQELRSFDSYWRRQSRGGTISHVVGSGLTKGEIEHLELAIHAALPAAEFSMAEDEIRVEKDLARVGYLALCSGVRVSVGDFTLPRPPRRSMLVGATCIAIAFGVWLGHQVRLRLQDRLASVGVEIRELESDKRSHVVVEDELHRLQVARNDLQLRKQQVREVAGAGVSGRAWLEFALSTFDQRAQLKSFHVDDSTGAESFSVSGSVPADPVQSVEALIAISESWQRAPKLGNYRLHLPTAVEESSSSGPILTFQITASIGDSSQ